MLPEKRAKRRHTVLHDAIIVDTAGVPVGKCVMVDVSATGAKLTRLGSAKAPDKFDLVLTKGGAVRRRCETVWRSEGEIGVRFVPLESGGAQTGRNKSHA